MHEMNIFELVRNMSISSDKIVFDLTDSGLHYLADNYEETLAIWAKKFDLKVLLRGSTFDMSISPLDIKIPTPVAGGVAADALVYTSYTPAAWNRSWLKTLSDLENCERPAALVELATGQQVWCNQLAADLLQLSPKQLLSIKSYDTWLEGELDKLWAEVRGGNAEFQLNYRVKHALSGDLISMRSQNQILELDGVFYRFAEALDATKVSTS